jgi:hypothetical protein
MRFCWLLLMLSLPGFGQYLPIDTQVKADTVISCKKKYLFQTISKSIAQSDHRISDVGFYVIALRKPKNDTLVAYSNLPEAELQNRMRKEDNENLAKDYEESISYEFISGNIFSVTNADYQYFEGAAHGENRYENALYDLETNKFFEFEEVFQDSVLPVIASALNKEFAGSPEFVPVDEKNFRINRYDFDLKNLILEFHYLDPNSPVHVSYAEQIRTVFIPFKTVAKYLKKGSPIYKMINGLDCWNPKQNRN